MHVYTEHVCINIFTLAWTCVYTYIYIYVLMSDLGCRVSYRESTDPALGVSSNVHVTARHLLRRSAQLEKTWLMHVEVSLNYCSQNGGNLYRAPYDNGNPNIGPRIDSNLGQSPCGGYWELLRKPSIFLLGPSLSLESRYVVSSLNRGSAM